jgi:hypothetical protein
MGTFLQASAGVIVGGFITWLVARYYYKRATKDLGAAVSGLQEETDKLKHLNALLLLAVESGGNFELARDEQGQIQRGPNGLPVAARIGGEIHLVDADVDEAGHVHFPSFSFNVVIGEPEGARDSKGPRGS